MDAFAFQFMGMVMIALCLVVLALPSGRRPSEHVGTSDRYLRIPRLGSTCRQTCIGATGRPLLPGCGPNSDPPSEAFTSSPTARKNPEKSAIRLKCRAQIPRKTLDIQRFRQNACRKRYGLFMDLITTTSELAAACARLARHKVITVDTEFLRETTYYPLLCVVQIASAEEAVVIDTLAEGIDLKPFFELMGNEAVLKVFHAARQDIEIVWHRSGTIPHPIFDTQVAAMVLGYGDSIAYDQLVERITGHRPDKTHRFTDWSRRP